MAKSNPLIPRVDIREADVETGKVLLGVFSGSTTGVLDVVGAFMPGCILLATDTAIAYKNTSTTDTPSFSEIDTSSGGLPALTNGRIWVGNASNVATAVVMSGDVTITNAGVAAIAAGVIVNADINASAAIDFSKLAALPSAQILVGSAGNVAAAVAVTGDIEITNAGVTSIAAGVIVNADINASAAIDFSKLAALTAGNILVGSAGNVATSVAMSGDAAISDAGVVTVTDLTITGETAGDILYFNGTNWVKLAIGTAGQVLTVNAGATAPEWQTP